MRKVKADALWNELSPEQLETLDRWVLEEHVSYAAAWPRAQAELGFRGSLASLKRCCLRRKQERTLELLEDLREDLAEINGAPGDPVALRTASTKLMGVFLFRQLQEAPEKVKEWAPVANLMVRSEYNDAVRELNRIRQEAMELAREKFHVNIVDKALRALPELKELAEAQKDPQLKRYEENARRNRVMRKMFGEGLEALPENAEEEAAMRGAGSKPVIELKTITDAQTKCEGEEE